MLKRKAFELPHKKEGVVRGVDSGILDWKTVEVPASPYDATVPPTVNVNTDNKFLPQQTVEDDTLSTTSTIEYPYSEEEEYRPISSSVEDSESDSEVEDGETEDSQSTDNEVEDAVTSQGTTVIELKNEYIPTFEDDWESGCDRPSQSDGELPSKNVWVDSWNNDSSNKEGPEKQLGWINVYAYYRKEKRDGGYGVILRNAAAKPIIASANSSEDGESFFYQLLSGINAGVSLAKKYKICGRYVRCNSMKVQRLLDQAYFCPVPECKGNKICKWCLRHLEVVRGCDISLWSLVQQLKCYKKLRVVGYPKTFNEAAHFLAKKAKEDHKLESEKKVKMVPNGEIKPDVFPQKLKDILWKDAAIRRMSFYKPK